MLSLESFDPIQHAAYAHTLETLDTRALKITERDAPTAGHRHLLSPKSSAALDRIGRFDFSLSNAERRALRNLFERLEQQGAPVSEI